MKCTMGEGKLFVTRRLCFKEFTSIKNDNIEICILYLNILIVTILFTSILKTVCFNIIVDVNCSILL